MISSIYQARSQENRYNPVALRARPVVYPGHFDNLYVDTGRLRVYVSRCSRADGACCEAHVTVEALARGGCWVTVREEHNG